MWRNVRKPPSALLCDRESACLPRQVSFKEQPEVQEICEVEVRTVKYSGPLTAEKVETGGDERTCRASGSSLAEVYPTEAQLRAKAKRKAKEELLSGDEAAIKASRKKKPQLQESHYDDCGSDDGLINAEKVAIAVLAHSDPVRSCWYEEEGCCGDSRVEVPDVLQIGPQGQTKPSGCHGEALTPTW